MEASSSHSRESSEEGLKQSIPYSEEEVQATKCVLYAFLPLELVDGILDLAMYWPSIVSHETRLVEATSEGSDNLIYFMAPPFLEGRLGVGAPVNVKMIKFSLTSCDQGWGGEPNMPGPYHGSWSWFETAIFRATGFGFNWPEESNSAGVECYQVLQKGGIEQVPNPVNSKKVWTLQRNIRAYSMTAIHEVVWIKSSSHKIETSVRDEEDLDTGSGLGVGFINSLVSGDRIAIIAKARYPGWINHVYDAKIEVFYSL
ncbi:hypothetical protein BDZ94DRAFT_1314218 [Collybia nuda]|uniref:Uncharacterized protein n=1 Tax=Collybia nuda TaxID=64659 RepID=A0A9P5XTH7_9AGAR|nr:hypothetical protein BDZ94DRAFT_1314218 [Collybia nuda]